MRLLQKMSTNEDAKQSDKAEAEGDSGKEEQPGPNNSLDS